MSSSMEEYASAPTVLNGATVGKVGESKMRQTLPFSLLDDTFHGAPVVPLYHLENYGFGTKDAQREKDPNVLMRMARMERNYHTHGMRRTVDAVLLVHNHGHPHILLLQLGQSFFKLPGGRLRPHEDEVEGLKRKLTKRLASDREDLRPEWEVSDLVATWWRPHFEPNFYPYIPPHVTKPKEEKKIFLVLLQENASFAVPSNLKLLAVPLFELYDNPGRYGPTIATLAQALSRFNFHCIPPVPEVMPPAADEQMQQQQQQQEQPQQ